VQFEFRNGGGQIDGPPKPAFDPMKRVPQPVQIAVGLQPVAGPHIAQAFVSQRRNFGAVHIE